MGNIFWEGRAMYIQKQKQKKKRKEKENGSSFKKRLAGISRGKSACVQIQYSNQMYAFDVR